jgi:hypothetical protein
MGTKNNPGTYDCYDKAEPDEPMFVLLARDPTASTFVRAWAYQSEWYALIEDEATPNVGEEVGI